MPHYAKLLAFFACWGGALWGILNLRLPGAELFGQHSICGPWGCGPPLSALVIWQGFWMVLLGGPVGLAIWTWGDVWVRRIGVALLGIGLLGVLGIIAYEAATYLPRIADGQPAYFVHRCLFSLVTLIDLPILPLSLAGIVMVCAPQRRRASAALPSAGATTSRNERGASTA